MKNLIISLSLLMLCTFQSKGSTSFTVGDFIYEIESPYDEFATLIQVLKTDNGVVRVPDEVTYRERNYKVGSFSNFVFVFARNEYGSAVFTDTIKQIYLPKTLINLPMTDNVQYQLSSDCEFIFIPEENEYYSVENGALFTKDKTIMITMPPKYNIETFIMPEETKTVYTCAAQDNIFVQNLVLNEGLEEIKYNGLGFQKVTLVRLPTSITKLEGWFINGNSVKDLYVGWEDPIYVNPESYHSQIMFDECYLHVPEGTISNYEAAPFWNQFWNIVDTEEPSYNPDEDNPSDDNGYVNSITNDESVIMAVYDINGRKIKNPQRGMLYIIKFSSGKLEKIIY